MTLTLQLFPYVPLVQCKESGFLSITESTWKSIKKKLLHVICNIEQWMFYTHATVIVERTLQSKENRDNQNYV